MAHQDPDQLLALSTKEFIGFVGITRAVMEALTVEYTDLKDIQGVMPRAAVLALAFGYLVHRQARLDAGPTHTTYTRLWQTAHSALIMKLDRAYGAGMTTSSITERAVSDTIYTTMGEIARHPVLSKTAHELSSFLQQKDRANRSLILEKLH